MTEDKDIQELDALLSPESREDVQAGREVCRALYTGLADVLSRDALESKNTG